MASVPCYLILFPSNTQKSYFACWVVCSLHLREWVRGTNITSLTLPPLTSTPTDPWVSWVLGTHSDWLIDVDWCCFHYFERNSLVVLLKALCARIFCLDSWISVFSRLFFGVYKVSNKAFLLPRRASQPGSCAWLSPFLLCADCTCVLLCVCLCMCMWKCVGKVINI